ncbi:amidohydrolase family protein [Amycolatopsis acidiphila]|uniref:Amidohydrolase family protein n=1 Tax=Amycolatopsis acidiphila TaxID=715473 RepID=A0A558A9U0_9PSEU|nr:amidohydrolase family protein [Amycolatopsis acidiphila]TVT21021.1 amidohydrolase family protein [Amycolatopsis acidiphila]UIJ61316.1 amidohydrolase family protein [Amycolatopsis acidiphila]GHG78254.1 2-pyrone-4,6-dicarboxylate hydrolase [Amycolatopsis acidiphila]
MTEPTCPGPDPDPKKPALALPAGSCDAHCHIFGPTAKFPYAPDRTFTPPEAPLEDLQWLHEFLGFQRSVIVQSAAHGSDHSSLLDALERGAGRYRGVALVKPATPDAEIARLHEAGVRGARLHFTPHLGPAPSPETIRAIVDKIRPYGWHLALHVAGDGIAEHEDMVRALPLTVVIDHMARVDLRAGLNSKPVTALLRLLESGSVWVKLSGADRIAVHPPDLRDAAALGRLLATEAPERVVWGTDFPHPNTHGFMPDDGDLVDLLAEIAPDEAALRRLLVENPARCFDF